MWGGVGSQTYEELQLMDLFRRRVVWYGVEGARHTKDCS